MFKWDNAGIKSGPRLVELLILESKSMGYVHVVSLRDPNDLSLAWHDLYFKRNLLLDS